MEYRIDDINNRKYKFKYLHYFFREIFEQKILEDRMGIIRKNKNNCCGYELPDINQTNDIIFSAIESDKPFALVRPGNGENSFAVEWEEEKLFGKKLYKRHSDNYDKFSAGCGNRVDEYQLLYRNDVSDADIFSVFPGSILEEYFVDRYCRSACKINYTVMNPISAKRPWTDALKGKRVLFVSQFADYLIDQYLKKEQIYNGKWMWPDFELIPVKSVWYFHESSKFPSMFEALDYLYNQIMKHDFDIAILSCGPLAIHLAPMIKRAGKQAIQYAGELQLLFGIKGARWDNNPYFKPFFNDSWIRVTKEQVGITEEESKNLDGGVCYW
ncbi:hypothetical protein [Butyrivibrio proteoclasticus]|uniref:hypothetical protein n=1 Tax=Butyrivibrio proteoclasticus TaxID=43305 RepID=UPI000479A712|nr:hypothetical protein [Butyrivibrio proteoclasticus]